MAEVRLRPLAEQDLIEILAYSRSVHGAEAARRYARGLRKSLAMLGDYPNVARVLEWVDPPVHCLRFGQHYILYDAEGDVVWVNRILHVARDLTNWSKA